MKWEKRSDSVYDLEIGAFDFRWLVANGTVSCMGGVRVANGIDTEEQATKAVRGYLEGVKRRGQQASAALIALDGAQ